MGKTSVYPGKISDQISNELIDALLQIHFGRTSNKYRSLSYESAICDFPGDGIKQLLELPETADQTKQLRSAYTTWCQLSSLKRQKIIKVFIICLNKNETICPSFQKTLLFCQVFIDELVPILTSAAPKPIVVLDRFLITNKAIKMIASRLKTVVQIPTEKRCGVIIGLQNKGFGLDFFIYRENLICLQDNRIICPDEFEIEVSYFFPATELSKRDAVIYGISLPNSGEKGILMCSCSAFIRGVSIHLWSKFSTYLKDLSVTASE